MTRDDRDWLTDDFPELRDAPPWVMEEMIFAQPRARGADPRRRPSRGDAAARRRDRCGRRRASPSSSPAAAPRSTPPWSWPSCSQTRSVARASRARAEARQALDAALDPRAGGVCIAISHDGGTRATKLALEAARESGATTGLITACADPSCTSGADLVFVTPVHDDSWCHTLAYVSAILAGARISGIAGDEAARRGRERHRVDPRTAAPTSKRRRRT